MRKLLLLFVLTLLLAIAASAQSVAVLSQPNIFTAPQRMTKSLTLDCHSLVGEPLSEAGRAKLACDSSGFALKASSNGGAFAVFGSGGTGTVTTVGSGTIASIFTFSVANATTTPAISLSFSAQLANCILAGPTSGGSASPTCRALVSNDIPSLAPSKITGTAVVTSDSRLSDSRTPTAHASTHASAGSDPVTLTEAQVTNLTTDLAAKLAASANLSDLASASTARTNLGLGSFALKNSLVSGDIPNNAANTSGNATTSSDGLTSATGTPPLTLSLATKALTGSVAPASAGVAGVVPSTGLTGAMVSTGAITDDKASLAVKPSCGVVATANLTLSGLQTIDGITGTDGVTIVLATAQTSGAENGPWVQHTGAWTRPSWYPSGGTTQAFQFVTTFIRVGNTYSGTTWRITSSGSVTIDTTPTIWSEAVLQINSSSVSINAPVSTIAGTVMALSTATATQTSSATAGVGLTITADAAVPGSVMAGAAAGGAVTITSGDAKRLTSGNAAGGAVNLNAGAGIGTGAPGTVNITLGGMASGPHIQFGSTADASGNPILYFPVRDGGIGPSLILYDATPAIVGEWRAGKIYLPQVTGNGIGYSSNSKSTGTVDTTISRVAAGVIGAGATGFGTATGKLAAAYYETTVGSSVASASTITPTSALFHVTGTTQITTINLPRTGYTGCIRLIPDAAFTTATGGNVALASIAVVSRVLEMCYDGTSWYPSY